MSATIINKISVFANLANSSKSIATISIQQALVAVKKGQLVLPNRTLNTALLVEQARNAGKGSKTYDTIKKYRIPSITWASSFTTGRNKKEGYEYSFANYFDIDGIEEDLEVVKTKIATIPCVKAVWISLSGKGIGGIIYTATENIGHYNAFVNQAAKLGYKIDPAVKDTTSRLNVLSYDPNAIIKTDKEVIAIEEIKEIKVTFFSGNIENINKKNVTVVEGSKAHKISYNYTTRKGLNYVSGERAAFIATYASLMNQFGVTHLDMMNEITKIHPDFDAERSQDIYNRYASSYASKTTDSISYTEKNVTSSYIIKSGQTLNDLGLTLADVEGKMLVSPTGSGKTYFITHLEGKKVVVVPSQKLSEELAVSYNGVCFNQFNKNVTNDDNLIFVTYASFALLSQTIDLSSYRVFLDEAHIMTASASRSFMLNELNSTVDTLTKGVQKSVTLLTATPINNAHPYLKQFKPLVVKSEVSKDKEFSIIRTADRSKLLLSVFAKAKEEGKFVAVMLNNTKDLLDSYTNVLKDYNVQVFNASKKSEDYFVELVNTGKIDSNVDGFITTSVLKEGNSFYFNEAKDVVVVVLGKFGAEEIEQTAARFRNASKTRTLVVRAADYEDKEWYFDAKREESTILEAAKFNVEYFNSCKFDTNPYTIKMTKNLNAVQETYCKESEDGIFDIDYLVVSNAVYEQEKSAAWNNTEFFVSKMSEFGWSFAGVTDFTATLTSQESEDQKEANQNSKEARKSREVAILDQIKQEGLEENRRKVDSYQLDTEESTIRFRVNYIYTYEYNEDKVFEIYEQVASTTQAWTQFERQVSIAKVKSDSSIQGREDKKLVDAIYAEFKVGETLNNENILSRLNKVIKETLKYKSQDKLTERKANKMLGWFFGIQDNVKKVDGKTVRNYTILNSNPCPVDIDTDNYREITAPFTTAPVEIAYNFGLFSK